MGIRAAVVNTRKQDTYVVNCGVAEHSSATIKLCTFDVHKVVLKVGFKVVLSMCPTFYGRPSSLELSAGGSSTGPIQGLAVRDGGVHVHRRWFPWPGFHCTCRLALRAIMAQGQMAEHRFRQHGLRVRDHKQRIVCLGSGFGPGGSPRPVAVPKKVTH